MENIMVQIEKTGVIPVVVINDVEDHFNLLMDRSPGFGSTSCNYRPIQTRFRFGSEPSVLNLAA